MNEMLSPHFNLNEFSCRCGCGLVKVVPALLYGLEAIREHFQKPVTVDCVCRCPKHNAAVGGEPDSQHLVGNAADIRIEGVSPAAVADYCELLVGDRGGVGRYGTFTHVDVRGSRARWKN